MGIMGMVEIVGIWGAMARMVGGVVRIVGIMDMVEIVGIMGMAEIGTIMRPRIARMTPRNMCCMT